MDITVTHDIFCLTTDERKLWLTDVSKIYDNKKAMKKGIW